MHLRNDEIEAFAHTIKQIKNPAARRQHGLTWAGNFKGKDENFNQERFLALCGISLHSGKVSAVGAAGVSA